MRCGLNQWLRASRVSFRGRSWIGKNFAYRREWIRHRFEFLAERLAVADLKQASEVSSVAAADRACEHEPNAGWLQPVALGPKTKAVREKPTKRRASNKGFLSMTVAEYLQLLDWTGRQIRRDGKLGTIPTDLKPLFDRMGISAEIWVGCVRRFGKWHPSGVGRPLSLKRQAERTGCNRSLNNRLSRQVYSLK